MFSRTRSDKPSGCPACAGYERPVPLSPTNNFAVCCADNSERGAQLLGEFVDPDKKATEVTFASSKKALWKCDTCEQTRNTMICNRRSASDPPGAPSAPARDVLVPRAADG